MLLALGAACSPTPPALAPLAGEVPGDPNAAQVAARGVQVEVDADAWAGEPRSFDTLLALQVRIANHSGRPLRLRYEGLALVDPRSGEQHAALPPRSIEGTAWAEVPVQQQAGGVPESLEGHGGSGFQLPVLEPDSPLGPALGPPAGGAGPQVGPVPPGVQPLEQGAYFRRRPLELPTPSMLQQALPEGVLQHGEQWEGFVYFARLPPHVREVRFRAALLEPQGERALVTLSLPFRVRE